MLRRKNGTERAVGETAKKGKGAVRSEYEAQRNDGPFDQDRAKEAGSSMIDRAEVDNGDARGIIGENRVDRAKMEAKGAHADLKQYREAETEEEAEGKKQGLLNRMKGLRVSFLVFHMIYA